MTQNKKVNQYKFEDSVHRIAAITYAHLLFLILFIAPHFEQIISHRPAQINLIVFLVFFIASFSYKWLSQAINICFLTFYIASLLFEFLVYGIPSGLIDFNSGYALSKGLMFDIIIALIPYVYFGLRLLFISPLIFVIISRKNIHVATDHSDILDTNL